MREKLLSDGYIRVFEDNAQRALLDLAFKLKQEGHAIVVDDVIAGDRLTSVTAHHYRTCSVCYPKESR